MISVQIQTFPTIDNVTFHHLRSSLYEIVICEYGNLNVSFICFSRAIAQSSFPDLSAIRDIHLCVYRKYPAYSVSYNILHKTV